MKRARYRLLIVPLCLVLMASAPPGPAGLAMLVAGSAEAQLPPPPDNITVASGYLLVPAITGLDFPTAIAFDPDEARAWIAEGGLDAASPPEILQVDAGGVHSILRAGDLPAGTLLAPLTDVTYQQGWLYLLHRMRAYDGRLVGAISRMLPGFPLDTFQTIIADLPAQGEHPLGELVFGPDGRGYFSLGTATNSGVVGLDTLNAAEPEDVPLLYDIPPLPVVAANTPYTSLGQLNPSGGAYRYRTAPLGAFGGYRAGPARRLPGASVAAPRDGFIAGSGTIYSFDPSAPAHALSLRLEAWGLRSPTGLGFDPFRSGRLDVLNQGADWRGSRPVEGDYDDLFSLRTGGSVEFFGWPDFAHDPRTGWSAPLNDPQFCRAGLSWLCPGLLLDEDFSAGLAVQPQIAAFEPHTNPVRFDISTSRSFGHRGDLFVAQSGPLINFSRDIIPNPPGFKVARLDGQSGRLEDFIRYDTQASLRDRYDPEGFNRPVDVKFLGPLMAVVDLGAYEPAQGVVVADSGKVWLVAHWRLLLTRRAGRGDPPAVSAWLPLLSAQLDGRK